MARGIGTPVNGVYPGFLRRKNEGTTQATTTMAESLADWDLRTSDVPATVEAAGYFNAYASVLPVGSVIYAVMGLGAAPKLKNYLVTANTGTAVTVALQTTTAG